MSATSTLTLDTLPTELIYRIFDNLGGEILVLSLHHVCKRFDIMVNTYLHQARYKLNFDHISLSNFIRVCRRIQPENVISLTFSRQCITSSQLSLFLSYFSTGQFTRLHSLTLLNVEDEHLQLILKHAIICPLRSLSIQSQEYSNRSVLSNILLSVIMEHPDLHYLTLNLMDCKWNEIKWPTSSTIQHLTLYHCHINYFPMISHHFPSLRTLFIRDFELNDDQLFDEEAPLDCKPMYQLTSLIMEDMAIKTNTITSILSNTPSLTHLRLTGNTDRKIDFQLEEIIQTKLPLLNQFEFFFYSKTYDDQRFDYTERLIIPFQTPFWLKIKNWYVTCDQIRHLNTRDNKLTYDIYLYSIPVRNYYFEYYPDSIRLTSTTSMQMNNDEALMDSVRTVYLKTRNIMAIARKNVENSLPYLTSTNVFRKALELKIRINSTWSYDFVKRISSLIDLSHLEKLTLIDGFHPNFYPDTILNFINLLEQAYNIHSLVITRTCFDEIWYSNMDNFCSRIPHHIKHLEIDVDSINDMITILHQLEHLSSVTFRFLNGDEHWQTELMEWISMNRNARCHPDLNTLHIWLGKKKSRASEQIIANNKCLHRTDHYSDTSCV